MITNIFISDNSLNQIKKGFGYPLLKSESEFLISEEDLKTYVIAPAMEEWFRYFPILQDEAFSISGGSTLSVDMPENFFGIVDVKFIQQTSSNAGGVSLNPFITQSNIVRSGSSVGGGRGMYGTPFDYGYSSIQYDRRYVYSMQINKNKVWRYTPNYQENTVELYSSVTGNMDILWGLYSNDFDNMAPPHKRQELINYCRAVFKYDIGNIIGLQDSELPSTIDFDTLRTQGEDEIERLRNKWAEETQFALMR